MRIVHAVYSLNMGGAEVFVGQLARLQRAQGHDVHVVAYEALGEVGAAMVAEGFEVRVLGAAHPLRTMARYREIFTRVKPDVVHCHNVAPTIQAALPARLSGVRSVLTTRHGFTFEPYPRGEETKYNAAGRLCDWMVGVCQIVSDGIAMGALAPRDRITTIYNGTRPVERVVSEETAKRGLTLLFVGRLAEVKDLGTLLAAVAIAKERVPELACWIVGDGPQRSALETQAKALNLADTVRFWGMRTDTDAFFSAADVFVMSSVTEGLPMSLVQSMSVGIPSLLTDVGGMGEVSRLTSGGLLVPVKDSAAYAEAIVRLATDGALRAELGANALRGYHERFTLERMGDRYMELYTSPRGTKPR